MKYERVAVITGGSRGLGAEIALALGRAGYRVAICYRTRAEEAERVAAEAGGLALQADVSEAGSMALMATAVIHKFGSNIDVLINNAGLTRDSLMARATESDWDLVMRTNLTGAMLATRALLPYMSERGGHIINILSRSGLHGKQAQAAYSASKAGLLGLTLSLARELGPDRVRVNAVAPGYMPTDMGRAAPEAMQAAMGKSVLNRLGSPQEVAAFIVWLVSTETISGQVFELDSRVG